MGYQISQCFSDKPAAAYRRPTKCEFCLKRIVATSRSMTVTSTPSMQVITNSGVDISLLRTKDRGECVGDGLEAVLAVDD